MLIFPSSRLQISLSPSLPVTKSPPPKTPTLIRGIIISVVLGALGCSPKVSGKLSLSLLQGTPLDISETILVVQEEKPNPYQVL